MTAAEMRQRADLLKNFDVADTNFDGNDDEFEQLLVSDSETDDDLNGVDETLMESHGQLISVGSDDDESDVRENVTAINTEEHMNLQSETENAVSSDTEINTEDIRSRLNNLLDSDDSDHSEGTLSLSERKKGTKRRRIQAFESDSENDAVAEDISSTQIPNETNTKSAIGAKKKKAIIESDEE